VGADDPETGPLERQALERTAGAILSRMGAEPDETKLVRVTGWPAGVVVSGATFYVNASWLVALAGEPAPAASIDPAPSPGGAAPPSPPKQPLSVDVNPYKLPVSIEDCAYHVVQTCACEPSSCSGAPTDPAFPDANAECEWVRAGPDPKSNGAALCALALMSIGPIDDCMKHGFCAKEPPVDHGEAAAMTSETCLAAFDRCLQGAPVATTQSSSGGFCGPEGCICNRYNCGFCYGSEGLGCEKTCTIRARQPWPNDPTAPFGWIWILLPPAYVMYRRRRFR
jgi:hypothetical protein